MGCLFPLPRGWHPAKNHLSLSCFPAQSEKGPVCRRFLATSDWISRVAKIRKIMSVPLTNEYKNVRFLNLSGRGGQSGPFIVLQDAVDSAPEVMAFMARLGSKAEVMECKLAPRDLKVAVERAMQVVVVEIQKLARKWHESQFGS